MSEGRLSSRQKYFCEICRRQLRDAHALKCHKTANSHLKNLDNYNGNPDKYKELNSQEFEDEFMHILANRHPSSTVPSLKVYHQTIGSRRNASLKMTRWNSFEEFIDYLKQSEKITVEETEHGQLIRYVNPFKMPEVKREAPRLTDEDRRRKDLENILKSAKPIQHPEFTELHEKPIISMHLASKQVHKILTPGIFSSDIEKVLPPCTFMHCIKKDTEPFGISF